MPLNRSQGRKSTRWYNICFLLASADSSDDSDIESVILPPTQTSTMEQNSPPHSPPSQQSETSWYGLSPPPPPPLPPPPPPLPPQPRQLPPFSLPPQINWHHPPLSPPQTSTRQETSPPHSPSSQESDTSWYQPLPPPPPPLLPPQFSPPLQRSREPQNNLRDPLPPSPSTSQTIASPETSPPHSLASQESEITWHDPLPPLSPPFYFPLQESHEPQIILRECHQIPDGVINVIRRASISELHPRDKISHCPICMEEFKVDEQVLQLPCNHTYCSECILRWLKTSKTCPICRLQLEGWEGQSSTSDTNLDLETPIPPTPLSRNFFFPSSLL